MYLAPNGIAAVAAVKRTGRPTIAAAAPSIASVSISGTAQIGRILTAGATGVAGEPAPTLTYQWTRNGAAIPGATAQTYALADADDKAAIRAAVTATNSAGSTGPVASDPVTALYAAPTAAGSLADVSVTVGGGAVTRDAGALFTGAVGGAWSVTVNGAAQPSRATIDGAGLVTVLDDMEIADAAVVARYANSGGAASRAFTATVAAAAAAPSLFGDYAVADDLIAPSPHSPPLAPGGDWADNGTIAESAGAVIGADQWVTLTIQSTTARRFTPATAHNAGGGVSYFAAAIVDPALSLSARLYLLRTSTNHLRLTVSNIAGETPTVSVTVNNLPHITVNASGVDVLEDGSRRIWALFSPDAAQTLTIGLGTSATNDDVTVLKAGFAYALPEFQVTDALAPDGDTLLLWLDPAWPGWATVDRIESELNGVAGPNFEEAGVHAISGLSADASYAVRIRAVYTEAATGVIGGVTTGWSAAV